MAQRPQYMHGTSEAEQQRLEDQADLLGGARFLPELRPGMRLLEVGCGPGAIARRVAAQVAPGEVVGVDRQTAYLETARRLSRAAGLVNARFVEADACDLRGAGDGFDGAYCRFVLEHVADPVQVVEKMRDRVRPGGWVCAYEWHNPSFSAFPECPSVRQVWAGIYALQQVLEGDCDVSSKLPAIFARAGLTRTIVRADAFAFTHRDGALAAYVDGAREIVGQTTEQLLGRRLVSETLLAEAEAEYAALLADPHAMVIEVMCCATGHR